MKLKEEKKLSKIFLSIVLFSVLSVLMILGCSKTEGGSFSDDEIKFTVGSMPNTKTAYTQENNSLQLIWVDNDQISIFCEQAAGEGKKEAAYKVTPDKTTPQNGTLSIAEVDGNGLKWNDDETKQHKLYAVYPSLGNSNGNVSKVSEGFFTFDFPKTQYCGTDKEYVSGKNHRLQPEMYLAYMVAEPQNLMPTTKPAKLLFKPIATTLEITLQGATQSNVEISGLKLSVKNLAGNFVKNNGTKYQIQFDATKDFSTDVSNSLTAYTSGSITATNFTLKLSGGGNYTLKAGESVTFTVFLPPIKNLDDVTVRCIGSDGATILGKKQILTTQSYASPASKSFFKMPPFKDVTVKEITLSPNPLCIALGDSAFLSATVKMSDGSTVNRAILWEVADTRVVKTNVPPIGISSSVIKVFASQSYNHGYTTKVEAFYGGESATAEVYIYKDDIPKTSYHKWYASINAPTKKEIEMYLGAGVYLVEDAPPYKVPDNSVSRIGLMVKKKANIPGFDQGTANRAPSVTPGKGVPYQTLKNDYFFLPACGYYDGDLLTNAGGYTGCYWSSTPHATYNNNAYILLFSTGFASVEYRGYINDLYPLF